MFASPFFRRLFLPYLVLICAVAAAVGFVGARLLRDSYTESVEHSLRDQLQILQPLLGPSLDSSGLQAQVERLGQANGCRITVIRADGTVIADNEANAAHMVNHAGRPEVVEAAASGTGRNVRRSDTTDLPMLYVAQRTPEGSFLRLAVHLDQIDRHIRAFYLTVGLAVLAAVAAAAGISFVFARRQARPMVELTHVADALSRGELHRRADLLERDEMGTLGGALNTMADSLDHLLAQARKDKAELLTILTSMSEGVIATDLQQRILLTNEAAGQLLGFDSATAQARLLFEVLLNDRILKSAKEVLSERGQRVFQIGPVSGRFLDITICLYPTQGPPAGLILVARDTTQSVRYQDMRKEFVANVSHELRTPLSVIKGFVETLLDGAVDDPDRAHRFLQTILRHTNQLANLVNDLLEISRLESQPAAPKGGLIDVPVLVRKVLDLLQPAAQARRQSLHATVPPAMPALMGHSDYLERAIANLVDNAIKYTPEGGVIQVAARSDTTHVCIEVIDNGIGIPIEDQPRIFERFYRVDRSRSREMGGTGLGLSIVKHIAQAHGGTIEVSSRPGAGSTFTLRLPLPPK